jgi:hypothetical protein
LLDKRLREMLGDFNGSFRTLEIPSLDWTLQLAETTKRPASPRAAGHFHRDFRICLMVVRIWIV